MLRVIMRNVAMLSVVARYVWASLAYQKGVPNETHIKSLDPILAHKY